MALYQQKNKRGSLTASQLLSDLETPLTPPHTGRSHLDEVELVDSFAGDDSALIDTKVDQIDSEIEAIKVELLRLGFLKESNLRNRKLENFIPSPKQLAFFENADKRERSGFCGNRFGKSTLGVVEDCSWLLGERPFFEEGNPLRRLGIPIHGVKGLVIGEDWEKVKEIFTNDEGSDRLGKFFEFLPEEKIKKINRAAHGVASIVIENTIDGKKRESIVFFDTVRSFVNNPKSFESSDWDFIHIDEPVMQELWTAVSRGLIDRGGKFWWLLTPLGFPWMYEYAITGAIERPNSCWWFEATMDDNPTLNEEAKKTYLASLTPDELECRRAGKPLAYGRRVYGFFDSKIHIQGEQELPPGWRDHKSPPPDYSCGYAIDTHPQTAHAVLFVAVSPTGDVYFYDEIFEKSTISELAQKIIEKNVLSRARIEFELCEPAAWIENPDTGKSFASTLHENGLNIIRASKQKTQGIMRTQELWKVEAGHRKVRVMPHLLTFHSEIKRYFFDKENKPVDKDDHIMECLYRLVMHNNLAWIPLFKNTPSVIFAKDEFQQPNYNLPGMANINI